MKHKKPKTHGNTIIPRNLVAKEMLSNPYYRKDSTIPPKKGKNSVYKRKKKHIKNPFDMLLFYTCEIK